MQPYFYETMQAAAAIATIAMSFYFLRLYFRLKKTESDLAVEKNTRAVREELFHGRNQQYQSMIFELFQMTLKTGDPSAAIPAILERLTRRLPFECICIFEDVDAVSSAASSGGASAAVQCAAKRFERSVKCSCGMPDRFDYASVPSWKDHLMSEIMINYPADQGLPADISGFISSTGVSRLTALPIFLGERQHGFICFVATDGVDEALWEELIVTTMFPATDLVSNMLEKKRHLEQLQELNATKDKFISILSHDLKSPISSLASAIELTLLAPEETEANAAGLKSARAAINRTIDLIDNVLKWARMQRGEIMPTPERFALRGILLENIELLKGAAAAKNIALIVEADDIEVFADRQMALTVARNLVSNAIKFTPTGGMVKLSLRDGGQGFAEVRVSDSGVGMSEKTLKKLFCMGEKIVSQGTAGEKGSGFGLVLCADFASRNGGAIRAESQPGKGSAFTFTLPMAK